MNTIIRREGRVSVVVGWMLVVMAFLALVTFIVLAIVIDAMFLIFLFAPVLLLLGAGESFWLGSGARLEITPDSFIWCSFVGRARSIAWQDLDRVLVPPPGSRPRLVAAARLKDGSIVEIDAVWSSPTSPANLFGTPDHSPAQRALIDGHRAYLAGTSANPGSHGS